MKKIDDLGNKKYSFNQSGSRFTILNKDGFHIITMDGLRSMFQLRAKDIRFVEMVFSTELVGWCTQNNKACIYCLRKKELVSEIPESRFISGIKFTQNFFILIFKSDVDASVDVYNRENIEKRYWVLKAGENNLSGVGAVNGDCSKREILAVPSESLGYVKICDLQEKKFSEFKCHENKITFLRFNKEGTKLATCSNGRNIKLVNTTKMDSPEILRSFKRGISDVIMYSICFSSDSSSLSCYSSSGTVHTFSLQDKDDGTSGNLTSSLYGLSYLGFKYFEHEWSNNKLHFAGNDYGVISYDEKKNNILYLVTKSGDFKIIDLSFNTDKCVIETKKLTELMRTTNSFVENGGHSANGSQIREKFPNHVPLYVSFVKVTGYEESQEFVKFDKQKYLVKSDVTVNQFARTFAKKIDVKDFTKIAFFIKENKIDELDTTLGDIFKIHSEFSNDGFLHLYYCV